MGNKLLIFAVGAAAGYAFAKYPREISQRVIKGGLTLGSRLRELQEEIAEDIEDQVAEARAQAATEHAG
jgi:hypothetical protein